MAGNFVLLMYYSVITGFMLRYFVDMAKGDFIGLDTAGVATHYDTMLAEPLPMMVFMLIVVALAILVCIRGLQNGLEKITKYMMLALLSIMLILAVNSVFLEGAQEGIKFYLMPSIDNLLEVGVGNVLVSAMNQAFFTLSLGMGAMAIFGSYIDKKRSLMGEAVNIACLDTFVALASGFIIFPACYAYDVDVTSGMPLIFLTLPNIFNHIPLGRFWGSLFFVFMSFAALTTIFTVFESIVSCAMDLKGWTRQKACLISGGALAVCSIPCVLGYNVWSGFQPLGEGTNIMVLEDFFVSNLALPLGALIFVIFCVTRYGWGWDNFVKEANEGEGLKIQGWMRGYMTYVLPLIVIGIFVVGISSYI